MAVFDLSSVPIDDRPAFVDERAIKSSVPFRAGAGDRSRAVDITHASAYFGDLEVVRTRFKNWEGYRSARQARDSSEPRLILSAGSVPQYDAPDPPRGGSVRDRRPSPKPHRRRTEERSSRHLMPIGTNTSD